MIERLEYRFREKKGNSHDIAFFGTEGLVYVDRRDVVSVQVVFLVICLHGSLRHFDFGMFDVLYAYELLSFITIRFTSGGII